MDDRELDLSQREADLAIRMRAPVQADLIQRKLFTVHYHMYASKEYLAAASRARHAGGDLPTTPSSSMARRRRRKSATSTGCWSCSRRISSAGCTGSVIRINNITGILQAVEAGLGIGVVPDYVAAEHPESGAGAARSAGARLRRASGLCRACASPSAWRRSATFWSRVPRTGSTEFSGFFRRPGLETPGRVTHFL